jgi:hypothetical protein
MFTQTSAATAMASSTAALPVSVRKNLRSGVCRFRAHAVRPEKGWTTGSCPSSGTVISLVGESATAKIAPTRLPGSPDHEHSSRPAARQETAAAAR